MIDKTRWVCPQCFTSIRAWVKSYSEKPKEKCPDHFNLKWVKVKVSFKDLPDEYKYFEED